MKTRLVILTYVLTVLITTGNFVFADDKDSIQVKNSEWKAGADKVVVRTVNIDFNTIEINYTISDWEKEY